MIGDYNPSEWNNPTYPLPLDITTIEGKGSWTFDLTQFAFGLANVSAAANETFTSYQNLTTDDYNTALMTLGHPGIGLPSPIFTPFVEMLNDITGNIWQCEEKYGYFCKAPVKCETFTGGDHASYDLSDYDFKIMFTSNTGTYLRVPLFSLMRNSQ